MTNQALSQAAIRIRAGALEPNPIDSAAITMAAEAVSSTEPIRSVFIVYSFLFDHLGQARRSSPGLRSNANFATGSFGQYRVGPIAPRWRAGQRVRGLPK